MSTRTWTVAQAKARFSEVLDQARSQGPQVITKHGRDAAVIVAAADWRRRTRRVGTLAEFFARSPLRGSGLRTERIRARLRRVDL
jgi:prevent-host-death family protein